MERVKTLILVFLFFSLSFLNSQHNPNANKLTYEERADEIISKMTLEEKASQMLNASIALYD